MIRKAFIALGVVGVLALVSCGDDDDSADCGGLTDCSGTCVDVATNQQNCGACGNVCSGGEQCLGGTCVSASTAPRDTNGDGVIDDLPRADENDCPPGETLCTDEDGASCENLQSSGGNCGACNNQCPSSTSCRDGACVGDDGGGDGGGDDNGGSGRG